MLFNLSKEGLHHDTQEVTLHPTLFGPRKPAIPTAKSVTIARIASPISTNRIYEPYFLQALQSYFQGQSRLVCKGDIIALPLDTDESRYSWKSTDISDAEQVRIGFDASK